jgi:hypothetical protein
VGACMLLYTAFRVYWVPNGRQPDDIMISISPVEAHKSYKREAIHICNSVYKGVDFPFDGFCRIDNLTSSCAEICSHHIMTSPEWTLMWAIVP